MLISWFSGLDLTEVGDVMELFPVLDGCRAVELCDLKLLSFLKTLRLAENSKPYHIIRRKITFKNIRIIQLSIESTLRTFQFNS